MTQDEKIAEPARADYDRLYTPWRMSYVRGERQDSGCVFCSMRDSSDDSRNLILHRGAHSYVVMNLFPYNTGHLLIVPNEHVASPEELSPGALHELADQLPRALAAARIALAPAGFNVGFNLGTEAGAGIAVHLHQHLVPRWLGDANFMPIIGGTKVLPELVPVTAAKLRAEFLRAGAEPFQVLILDRGLDAVLVDSSGLALPRFQPEASVPVWRSALDLVAGAGINAWVTGLEQRILLLEANSIDPDNGNARWLAVDEAGELIPEKLLSHTRR